ncbi:MAG: ATP-dependent RNA helicase HrpA [Gammaproteobacteria bacterium]|nr:ATP-dependent RNA helicase HrpA [Gammaproteobacteria bacterium]
MSDRPTSLPEPDLLSRDRPEYDSLTARMQRRLARGQPADRLQAKRQQLLDRSGAAVAGRRERVPVLTLPPELPITDHGDAIRAALESHQVLVVAGETGSGKTTQLPKLALAAGRGVCGLIGHTQPRRIAARSVATRIAEELGSPLGQVVGYQTRFEERLSPDGLIKVMTDGILLAETRSDPELRRYDTLIIDEAHERSLNVDFLLGYLKRLLPRRPDLKLIITSATIDVERFARHFQACADDDTEGARAASVGVPVEGRAEVPVFNVSGRTFPVTQYYLPPEEQATDADGDVEPSLEGGVLAALQAIRRLERSGEGTPPEARDVLVFLPGERDIRDLGRFLGDRLDWPGVEVLPLYARLTAAEQQRVFSPGAGRRIVLATNVAETSLTVPRIGYVIDPGLARISRYSYRSKLQRLPVEAISQASAAQRAGRCGRLAPGICYRLYSEQDFSSRDAFTDPEILRTNLAAVVLQMKELGLGDPEAFPFLDPPEPRALSDGRRLLEELGALDGQGALTAVGRDLCALPLDPRLARMLVAARDKGCLAEMICIVSALSLQDPRLRPMDKTQAADEAHAEWRDPQSDFLAFVRLWDWFEAQRKELSRSALRRACERRFLSWMRLQEWWGLQRQVIRTCRERGWRIQSTAAAGDSVHQALLCGLLSQLGMRTEKQDYLGARGLKFQIFPGSALFKRQPPWLLAAEIVETSRVYARTVAALDPSWVEAEAMHLVRRQHEAPRWQRRRGRVMVSERVTLYGLPIVEGRQVPFDHIDAAAAREIFILDGLARGDIDTRGTFLAHNLKLIEDVRALEARERRRDLLIGEDALALLYGERIPADIADARRFEKWRRKAEARDPSVLHFTLDDLMAKRPDAAVEADYPGQLEIGELRLELSYSFAPGTAGDGVTLRVPRALLPQLRPEPLDWLVPGMLEQKCVALLRGLPKRIRRELAPVPDHVAAVMPYLLDAERFRVGSLLRTLTLAIERTHGVVIPADAWEGSRVEDFLRMRIAVIGDDGAELAAGRDLQGLQAEQGAGADADLRRHSAEAGFEVDGLTEWSFGELPETVTPTAGVRAWPALVDDHDSVAIRLFSEPESAEAAMRAGVVRLLLLAQQRNVRQLDRRLPRRDAMGLMYAPLGDPAVLFDQILKLAVEQAHLQAGPLPRDRQAFDTVLDRGRSRLAACMDDVAALAHEVLAGWHELRRALDEATSPAFRDAVDDIRAWLADLLGPEFLLTVPPPWRDALPRYLRAERQRLAQLQGHVERDRHRIADLAEWRSRLEALEALVTPGHRRGVVHCRWLLEEYRVSLFAQELGTLQPVSPKRLRQAFAEAEESLRLGS